MTKLEVWKEPSRLAGERVVRADEALRMTERAVEDAMVEGATFTPAAARLIIGRIECRDFDRAAARAL